MNESLLHTIESFPPLPESIHQLNELCGTEDVDLRAFTRVIESDPLLYTDILRYSNVPSHGFRYPITSISQAIALFGVSAIRGMSLAAALKANPFRDISPYGISIPEWFSVMERQQHFTDLWLGKKHRSILQSVGGVTFILEIGRLVASYGLMQENRKHTFVESGPDGLILEEAAVLGKSGDALAAELFRHWNFDPFFVNALEYSLNPGEGSEPKTCAALKCARLLFTLKEVHPFETVVPFLERYGFQPDDAKVAYEIVLTQS